MNYKGRFECFYIFVRIEGSMISSYEGISVWRVLNICNDDLVFGSNIE